MRISLRTPDEASDAPDGLLDVVHARRVGEAEAAFSELPECRSRKAGDPGFVEEPVRENSTLQPRAGDVRENVERPLGVYASNATNAPESLDDPIPTPPEFAHHSIDSALIALEGLDRCFL